MKTTFTVLVAVATAAFAQDLGSLPQCGQTCIGNMLGIASSQLGCSEGDIACYCSNPDFGYGIRDCSSAACSAEEAASVISYGTNYCANAVQDVAESVTESASALTVLSSAEQTITSELDEDEVTRTATVIVSSSPLVAIITESDTVITTTTGFTTIVASSSETSTTTVSETVTETVSETVTSTTTAAESTSSEDSEAASASESAASTTDEPAAAPHVTAGSLLGAAGVAALLLL